MGFVPATRKGIRPKKSVERATTEDHESPITARSTSEEQDLEALRIKTFASAVRTRVLVAFSTCGSRSGISVKQLSEKLGMPHGTVFYHVKQLQKAAFIEEAGTREVNGILERFYRPVKQLVRFSPQTAARMDIPINIYFEEVYQQTRKYAGRRSLMSEEIFVDERERTEFIERYTKLCGEYSTKGEGKMHLAAVCATYEVREEPGQDPCSGDKDGRSDKVAQGHQTET
jgi:DNA-binding transcriptional ArsR family regulator